MASVGPEVTDPDLLATLNGSGSAQPYTTPPSAAGPSIPVAQMTVPATKGDIAATGADVGPEVTDPGTLALLNGGAGSSGSTAASPSIPTPVFDAFKAKALANIQAQSPGPQPTQLQVATNPMASVLPGPLGQLANTMTANAGGMGQGMTNGLGDELFSGTAAGAQSLYGLLTGHPSNPVQNFNDNQVVGQQQLANAQQLNPSAYNAGDATGSLGQGLMSGGIFAGRAKQTLASMIGRAAADGSIYGAINAFGRSNGDVGQRVQAAVPAAAIGAVGGAMTGLAGGAVANGYRGGNGPPPPSLDDLRTAKNAAYNTVDTMGVRYTPDAYSDMVDSILKDAASKGVSVDRHPSVVSVLKEMAARANQNTTVVSHNGSKSMGTYAPTLKELDQWRQIVTRDLITPSIGNPAKAAEAEFGHDIVDAIDHMIDTAKPAQVARGVSPEKAAAAIRAARKANTVYRKVETIDRAAYAAGLASDASGTGANYINTIRQKFKEILLNPKRVRAFNPLERQLMERIVHGEPIENIARSLGKKLSLNSVNAAPYAIVGTLFHPAAGLPVVGLAAKAAAEQIALKKIAQLREVLVAGGNSMPTAKPQALPVRQGIGAVNSYQGATVPQKPQAQVIADLAGLLAFASLPMHGEAASGK